jgi:hypothetical protein
MRNLHGRVPAQPTTICLVTAIIAMWLLGACTPTQLVVTDASPLAGIRTVYVRPFSSGNQEPHAAAAMTHALKAQLQEDGFFQVVEDPMDADAYFRGTVGKWARGGLDWKGARSTVISGTLTLLTAAEQRLWYAAAVQQDPWRLVAHGLFARDPSALATAWVKTVLEELPGYVMRERPGISVRRNRGALRPAS